jgi:hypothetical protein
MLVGWFVLSIGLMNGEAQGTAGKARWCGAGGANPG